MLGQRVRVFGGVELVREGGKAAEADVQDYAEGPYVNSFGVAPVFAIFEDLRGDVGRSSTSGGYVSVINVG